MRNRFYLTSAHGDLGSNIVWHRHEGRGYSTDIDQAHVYTLKEAQEEWEYGICQPISADHVDALAVWKVDHQYIPNTTQPFTDIHNTYVAFKKGKWDGNDVYWLNIDKCITSTDFDNASVFGYPVAKKLDSSYVVIPFDLADKVKRRTFQRSQFNRRKMVQAAGLRVPDIVKKQQRRVSSPMTRFNCPSCGRITWQDYPYDFLGCRNVHCDEWSMNA